MRIRWKQAVALLALTLAAAESTAQESVVTTTTLSTSSVVFEHDTVSTVTVETYSTQLLAVLDGTTTVYDTTFPLAIGDPAVVAAIAAASLALEAAAAPAAVTIAGPFSPGPTRVLSSTATATPVVTRTDVTESIIVTTTVGPASILIGDLDLGGTPYFVSAGTTNFDANTQTRFDIYRDVVTTNTFLTSAVYTLVGTRNGPVSVPVPGVLALMTAALGAWAVAARRARCPSTGSPVAAG